MPTWTPSQLASYELRNAPKTRESHSEASPLEAPLQDQIEAECNRRGWVCVRTRMDRKTTFTTPGVPDAIIALPNNRVLWLEAKSKTNKQTPEQKGFQMRVERLGHEYALVRSFQQFLELINRP